MRLSPPWRTAWLINRATAPGTSSGLAGRVPLRVARHNHLRGGGPSPPAGDNELSGWLKFWRRRRLIPVARSGDGAGRYGLSRWSRRADRILAAPFEPAVPAPTQLMEVVAPHLRAVAVEMHANLVPGAASRSAALVREGRERGDVHGLHSSAHYLAALSSPPSHREVGDEHHDNDLDRMPSEALRGVHGDLPITPERRVTKAGRSSRRAPRRPEPAPYNFSFWMKMPLSTLAKKSR